MDGYAEFCRKLGICRGCEHYRETALIARCALCGCLLAAKAMMAHSTCPLNKWRT